MRQVHEQQLVILDNMGVIGIKGTDLFKWGMSASGGAITDLQSRMLYFLFESTWVV